MFLYTRVKEIQQLYSKDIASGFNPLISRCIYVRTIKDSEVRPAGVQLMRKVKKLILMLSSIFYNVNWAEKLLEPTIFCKLYT